MELPINPDKIKDVDAKEEPEFLHGSIDDFDLNLIIGGCEPNTIAIDSDMLINPGWKSELTMQGDLAFQLPKPRPNRWWRLWQYVFFGFKWKDLTK